MKRLLFIFLVLCLCLAGCSNKEGKTNEEIIPGVTYDCVQYDTIEEMNSAIGSNITSAAIAGKSDEKYEVIGKNIAQYTFKANGFEWCIRASKDTENDISGLYYDTIRFEKDITSVYYTDYYDVFRFFYNDTQYVIFTNVEGKEISTTNFDRICNEFKTNITGVKSGYEVEVFEDGDDVIYRYTSYNDDGSIVVSDVIYTFDGDKMVNILNKTKFDSKEKLQEYCDLLVENGVSLDAYTISDNTLIKENNANLDFYSDTTRQEFIDQMKAMLE